MYRRAVGSIVAVASLSACSVTDRITEQYPGEQNPGEQPAVVATSPQQTPTFDGSDCAYQIRPGDTLFSLVEDMGIPATVDEVAAHNGINKNELIAGRFLDICVNGSDAISQPVEPITTVAATTTIAPSTSAAPAQPATSEVTTSSTQPAVSNRCNVLREGSGLTCAPEVKNLQNQLNNLNCEAGPADGLFAWYTIEAVMKFQYENGLEIDGIAGPATTSVLKSPDKKPCVLETTVDNDTYDTLFAQNIGRRTIVVQQINSVNHVQLYDAEGKLVDQTIANTGRAGDRTRNGIFEIFNESYDTEAKELTTNASPGVSPKQWMQVRQVISGDQAPASGLMGDPHTFDGGIAFHWRVVYGGTDETGKSSVPVLDANGRPAENGDYNGGYESLGCVHVEFGFLGEHDSTFFNVGTLVIVKDQPTV